MRPIPPARRCLDRDAHVPHALRQALARCLGSRLVLSRRALDLISSTYAARGQADTSNASDGIYRQAGARSILPLKRKGASVSGGYNGALSLGVKRS